MLCATNKDRYNQWYVDVDSLVRRIHDGLGALDSDRERLVKELEKLSSEEERAKGLYGKIKTQTMRSLDERRKKLVSAKSEVDGKTRTLQDEFKKKYLQLHGALQRDLQLGAHPLCPLIRDLLSYKAEDRPTVEEAEARFLRQSRVP